MKKIISMTLFADPRTQGGIETFNRTLKKFYPKEWIMITNLINKPKLYEVSDIIEIGSKNIFFRLINKILKNQLREKLTLKKVKQELEKIIIFSFPQEIYLLKDIKAKKILVQHTSFEHFIKSYCENNKKYINIIKNLDILVVLSPYDVKKFQAKFELKDEQIKVIRHSSIISILEERKEKNKNLIMIGRIDNNSKRLDLAIRAMKKLPDFTLNIYGDIYNQKDMEFLQEIMEKEKITNVNFKGGTNKVQEKLDESGIFIMTSDYEAYGIVNIEAMRRGLPIIIRNTFEGASDVVINNGILLDSEWNEQEFCNGIRKIYENYDYYSKNSAEMGKRHSLDVIKKEWEALFNSFGE